jgi:hypothetical protein
MEPTNWGNMNANKIHGVKLDTLVDSRSITKNKRQNLNERIEIHVA